MLLLKGQTGGGGSSVTTAEIGHRDRGQQICSTVYVFSKNVLWCAKGVQMVCKGVQKVCKWCAKQKHRMTGTLYNC